MPATRSLIQPSWPNACGRGDGQRPPALLDGPRSSTQHNRETVGCGLAIDDRRLHVTARIAFVCAQVGVIVLRQALEVDEARLQRAQLAARTRQGGERPGVRGGAWNLDLLGHAVIETWSARRGKRIVKFPYKFQCLRSHKTRFVRFKRVSSHLLKLR